MTVTIMTRPHEQDPMGAKVAELAKLSPLEYDKVRKSEAEQLGVRTATLDAAVAQTRSDELERHETSLAQIESLDPWTDPVDGQGLAEEIRQVLADHVIFAARSDADVAALWVLGTYMMDIWRLWPRLMITSPTKACGKSTLLEVLEAMVHRGLILSNARSAGVFRSIEAWGPTLLLDEADTWAKQDEELAGILNSGHTRRTARVVRVVEFRGELQPVLFSTWCPMAIAGIGSQRDTLMSRSIVIGLRRKLGSETVKRMPIDLHEDLTRVRRQALRWATDLAGSIEGTENEPPECGNDRRRDNFTPLWRIAEALGGPWPDRVASAYASKPETDEDDEPAHVVVLRDVLSIIEESKEIGLSPSVLIGDLIVMDDRPWADWRNGRPLTANALARMLKSFGIRTTVQKSYGKASRIYLKKQLREAARPYLEEKRNRVTSEENQQDSGHQNCSPVQSGYISSESNTLKNNKGYTVTDSERLSTDYERLDESGNPDAWK